MNNTCLATCFERVEMTPEIKAKGFPYQMKEISKYRRLARHIYDNGFLNLVDKDDNYELYSFDKSVGLDPCDYRKVKKFYNIKGKKADVLARIEKEIELYKPSEYDIEFTLVLESNEDGEIMVIYKGDRLKYSKNISETELEQIYISLNPYYVSNKSKSYLSKFLDLFKNKN